MHAVWTIVARASAGSSRLAFARPAVILLHVDNSDPQSSAAGAAGLAPQGAVGGLPGARPDVHGPVPRAARGGACAHPAGSDVADGRLCPPTCAGACCRSHRQLHGGRGPGRYSNPPLPLPFTHIKAIIELPSASLKLIVPSIGSITYVIPDKHPSLLCVCIPKVTQEQISAGKNPVWYRC